MRKRVAPLGIEESFSFLVSRFSLKKITAEDAKNPGVGGILVPHPSPKAGERVGHPKPYLSPPKPTAGLDGAPAVCRSPLKPKSGLSGPPRLLFTRSFREVAFDVLELFGPAGVVAAEGLLAAVGGELVKS